jgi:hypothetical protein
MGSTGVGRHFFLLHDFQPLGRPGIVPTTNGVVDWWLFLIPAGGEWDAFDEKPVHVGLCPVLSDRCRSGLKVYLNVLEFMFRVLPGIIQTAEVAHLSSMDRVKAARWVNSHVAQLLTNPKAVAYLD